MKKLLLSLVLLIFSVSLSNAALKYKTVLTGSSTTGSGSGRAPQVSHRHTRSVYLITAAEMSAGGIIANTILKSIGFDYYTYPSSATGNLTIYLQNTTDQTFGKSTTWATIIGSMTKVSDGTVIIPAAATADFVFQNGSEFTYSGGGLYVAFEYSNSGTLGTANAALCTTSMANGIYTSSSSSSATGASNTVSASNYRPQTRLAYEMPNNDMGVGAIYAMSQAPVNEGLQTISARIFNLGITEQQNVNVTLTVSGANSFTSTKNIDALSSEDAAVVYFDDFVPTNEGTNDISVSIALTDDVATNNAMQIQQQVVKGRFSYNIGTASASSSYGFNDGTGVFAAKYKANGTVNVKAIKFKVGNDASNSPGKPIQAVLINSAGTTLATSSVYTIEAGDIDKFLVLSFDPANVTVTDEEFYVGVALLGGGVTDVDKFYPIAVQPESPLRPVTFYSTGTAYDSGATTTFGLTSVKPMMEAITSNAVLNSDVTTVNAIYALGKNPLTIGAGEIMQAVVTNDGETVMENIPVGLAVSGANTFTSTKTITKLGAGQSATVSFDAFTATAKGSNTITVTANNETAKAASVTQVITDGIFSYADEAPRASNYGTSSGDLIFLTKYSITGTKKIKAVRLRVGAHSSNTGKSIYAVLTDGNGNVVARSDSYTIQSADLNIDKDFLLQTPTSVTDQNFMVGIALETAQQYYPIGVQNENPVRTGAYYTSARTSNTLTASTAIYRYMISAITEDEVLPVNISTFAAKLNNNKVALNWTVGSENNVNRYEVERSSNGVDFVKVATVLANGSSSYAAVDASPSLGINYYRLRGVDNDGTISSFNELRTVKVTSLEAKEAIIYPNPLVGNTINVNLSGYSAGTYQYKLADVSGKVVQQGSFVNTGASSNIIVLSGTLAKGVYLLQVINGADAVQARLVKQ